MSTVPTILLSITDKSNLAIISEEVIKQFSDPRLIAKKEPFLSELISEHSCDIFICDCNSPEKKSFSDYLQEIQILKPQLLIILIIPEGRGDLVSTAIEHDVFFYLNSPIDPAELAIGLKRADLKCSHTINSQIHPAIQYKNKFPGFIGQCPTMLELFDLIGRIADDEFSTVLIRGESGTGKELVARAIHSRSRRKNQNFVPVNCAAIPDDLLESELFGHMKGSFTGATQSKQGRIQYADGGTLFLDEIGDMKPTLQAKLLRVLQEKEFEPVGSLKAIPVNTRVVAATHCDLEQLVKEGQFREDLYYRLSVIPLKVPPLRNRNEDIPILLAEFIDKYTTKRKREKIFFTQQTISVLMEHEWRGNVRELENLVQHMSILYSGKHIHPHDLPEKYTLNVDISRPATCNLQIIPDIDINRERAELFAPPPLRTPTVDFTAGPINFNELINEFEKELIIEAMRMTSGNKKEAARILTLKRTTLLEKIKKKELNGLWEN